MPCMAPLLNVDGRTYPLEACILDKDGTLLGFDHWLEVMRMRAELLAGALSLSRSQLDTLLRFVGLDGGGRSGEVRITVLPRSEAEEAVAEYVHSWTGTTMTRVREKVRAVFARVDELFPFERYVRATPGAEEFLRGARQLGVKIAVVTHDGRAAAERHLQALSWLELVDVVIGVEDMKALKPAPDGVLKACELLRTAPGRSLMAGDTPADVGAGLVAGCRPVIGLLTGLGESTELSAAHHVVDDLTALSFSESSR